MTGTRWIGVVLVSVATACGRGGDGTPTAGLPDLPSGVQAISLLGDTLQTPRLSTELQEDREAKLAEARAALEADPASADAIIWVGRRTAYLGEYRQAVEIYTQALGTHPADPRLYRHRGHRYITLRLLDRAEHDLTHAASLVSGMPDEVEPDGLPNARNIPTSTLQSNIWYHLGLARYLRGDFDGALEAYRECLEVSTNPDMLVATSYWLTMTLRRLGREAEARTVLEPITAEMDIIENDAYHRLLLLFKGQLQPEAILGSTEGADALQNATLAYGVGSHLLMTERADEGMQIFRTIVAGSEWAAFGYIAAEAELARRGVTSE